MAMYFGFAIADSMFSGERVEVTRSPISPETVDRILRNPSTVFCVNPSHKPTIDAAVSRYGFRVVVPEPQVALGEHDQIIVMSVRGLPRLENRHEYTQEEIDGATFTFAIWTVTYQAK